MIDEARSSDETAEYLRLTWVAADEADVAARLQELKDQGWTLDEQAKMIMLGGETAFTRLASRIS